MSNNEQLSKNKKEGTNTKAFVILSTLTVGEKILGFILQSVIAAVLGATIVTDCYYSVFELTTLIDQALVVSTTVVLLKLYADKRINCGYENARFFLSQARMIIMPIMLVLSLCIVMLALPISYIIAPGYQEIERSILVSNIRWLAFLPTINAYSLFYVVILRYNKSFLIAGLKSLCINLFGFVGVFLYILFQSQTSFYLCVFYNVGLIAYSIIAHIGSHKWDTLKIVKPGTKQWFPQFLKMLLPLIVSNGIVRLSFLVDKIISSSMGEGAITCQSYAQMLFYFVESIFIINISTIMLTDFINYVSSKNNKEIRKKINNALLSMVILLVPVSILTIIFSREIVSIVFLRGNFTMSDVEQVAKLLGFYAVGFIPAVISNIYMQVCYAYGNTKVTLKITIVTILSNILISIFVAMSVGLVGVAIGTCGSQILSSIIYAIYTRRMIRDYKSPFKIKFLFKIFVSGIVCILISYGVQMMNELPVVLLFVIATILAVIGYLGTMLALKEETTAFYFKLLVNKLIRREK